MAASLPDLFEFGASGALRTLEAIYAYQWRKLLKILVATAVDINNFDRPEYWEERLKEAEDFQEFEDQSGAGRAQPFRDVIKRLAEQGTHLDYNKEDILQEYEETLEQITRVKELLILIEKQSFREIISFLEEEAAEQRSLAANLESIMRGRESSDTERGPIRKADQIRAQADLYEIFIRVMRSKIS